MSLAVVAGVIGCHGSLPVAGPAAEPGRTCDDVRSTATRLGYGHRAALPPRRSVGPDAWLVGQAADAEPPPAGSPHPERELSPDALHDACASAHWSAQAITCFTAASSTLESDACLDQVAQDRAVASAPPSWGPGQPAVFGCFEFGTDDGRMNVCVPAGACDDTHSKYLARGARNLTPCTPATRAWCVAIAEGGGKHTGMCSATAAGCKDIYETIHSALKPGDSVTPCEERNR